MTEVDTTTLLAQMTSRQVEAAIARGRTAVVVPFAEDDSIDLDALRANIGHLIEGGVHGLVVNGTMGEAGSLSDDERSLVIDTALEVADGRLPVTVGVSSVSTAASARYAEQTGAAGAP
jgi:4-hydroxy-tetrahydrodipicolinate synthase